MRSTSLFRWAALLAAWAASAAASAQEPVFVATESQPLRVADATGGASTKLSGGNVRPSPVLMETRAHVHADGSLSTTCAAIPSSAPHSVAASRPITKQQER